MDADLKALISSELTAAVALIRGAVVTTRAKAARMVDEADEAEERANRMEACDAAGTHKFRTTPGSGMLGDRFEEKCIHCGWIHTS